MIHFSALAFLGTHKFDEFVKLILFNIIIMAEPTERRSMRLRKLKIHFDDQIAESLRLSKPFRAPKILTKLTESAAQPITITVKFPAFIKPSATKPSNS